jgi:hypothetical protein
MELAADGNGANDEEQGDGELKDDEGFANGISFWWFRVGQESGRIDACYCGCGECEAEDEEERQGIEGVEMNFRGKPRLEAGEDGSDEQCAEDGGESDDDGCLGA